MVEPFSSTALLAASGAGGAWLAGKILGPSADRLGSNLVVYLESRVPVIFGRAQEIAEHENLKPEPIHPGLLTRMVIDASMSAESDQITEWWARMFLDAACHMTEANRHVVFSDIMSALGPAEVGALSDFVGKFQSNSLKEGIKATLEADFVSPVFIESKIADMIADFDPRRDDLTENGDKIRSIGAPYPMRATSWRLPYQDGGELLWKHEVEDWYQSNQIEFSILERSNVLVSRRHSIPMLADHTSWIEFLSLTPIGKDFFETCTGRNLFEDKT